MPESQEPHATRTSIPARVHRWLIREDRRSRIREIAISTMVIVILSVGVVSNLPAAALTQAASSLLDPIALATGLDQNWSIYAPTPPQRQEDVEVHIAMADGTEKVWTFPQLNSKFDIASSHRWRKFKESLLTQTQIRADFVHWVVRKLTRPGDRPVRSYILLRTRDIPPPGVREPGRAADQTLYNEMLGPDQ